MSDENGEEEGEDALPLKVRDVMVREVITVDENASVKEARAANNKMQTRILKAANVILNPFLVSKMVIRIAISELAVNT